MKPRGFAVVLAVMAVIIVPVGARAAGLLTLLNHTNSLDFGRQDVGSASPAQALTVSNSGEGTLSIASVGLTGVNPGDFNITGDTCSGAALASGDTCAIAVRFAPTVAGDLTARVTITDDAPGSPHRIPVRGTGGDPAAPRREVGPIDIRHGFPLWYQDEAALRLGLCLDANGLCFEPLPDPAQPPSVTDESVNFPAETFWWAAEASIPRSIGGKVQLVLAMEAAFTTEEPTVGEQISFGRVRIRMDKLRPGNTYKVTHPYGVDTLVADEFGAVRMSEDIGCGASPCDFTIALRSRVGPFLRWDPAVPPAPPPGYIGDPAVLHRVIGSPFGANFFRVEGQDVGGPGVDVIQTDLFVVQGKRFSP